MQTILTKGILKLLPKLKVMANLDADKVLVPLKVFNPTGGQTWFITELNPDTLEAFGYVTGMGEAELGYIDMNELLKFRGRMGLPLERDIHWDPRTTLAQVMDGEKS